MVAEVNVAFPQEAESFRTYSPALSQKQIQVDLGLFLVDSAWQEEPRVVGSTQVHYATVRQHHKGLWS